MSGSIFAQILPVIFFLVLSRIYSSGDFAGFVVFIVNTRYYAKAEMR